MRLKDKNNWKLIFKRINLIAAKDSSKLAEIGNLLMNDIFYTLISWNMISIFLKAEITKY